MNSTEIDRLFWALENKMYRLCIQLSDFELRPGDDVRSFFTINYSSIMTNLMHKIEHGDYEYFKSKIISNTITYSKLISFSSNKEDIKDCIDYGAKIHTDARYMTDLIIASNDLEYIKYCIYNYDKYNLHIYNLTEIIKGTNDSNFIKECIERRKELGIISTNEIVELIISTNDSQYIKHCLENKNEYRIIYAEDIIKLTKSSGDTGYIKKCIANLDYLETDLFDINNIETVVELIIATNNPEYIKSCIDNRKEFRISQASQIADLIKNTRDPQYIKQCIENRLELNIDNEKVLKDLIICTKDPKYIKKCIENKDVLGLHNSFITLLLLETNDTGYIKKYIERNKRSNFFDEEQTIQLIRSTHDINYIMHCIKNNKKYGIYESFQLVDLIKSTNDFRCIRKCIKNKYNLSLQEIIDIIKDTQDLTTIKSFINSPHKYRLNHDDIISLVLSTGDIPYIKEYFKFTKIDRKDIKTHLNLPPNMTFGIEIESEGKSHVVNNLCSQYFPKEWITKGDISLSNTGIEVVSPVLTIDTPNVEYEIADVCNFLNNIGQTVSERCGGHIHIGANYLTSAKSWENLKKIWNSMEEIFYLIGNKEGELPRQGIGRYAKPLSNNLEKFINLESIDIEDIKELCKASQEDDRMYGINFLNVGMNDKNTIEFRIPNGTIDYNTWIENINLFGQIINLAERVSVIQLKDISEITEEDKNFLVEFEDLVSKNITNKQRLDLFLKLSMPENDRIIYINRFEENSKLLMNHPWKESIRFSSTGDNIKSNNHKFKDIDDDYTDLLFK